ncbi:hypothetical protein [Azospira restricta]|uniref:hypothetical protein n=1 Tax=Azospira restricta TaxID=404405 RepID=UPI001EF0FB7C|nr:hypothetical protein [Azospira restricta]
MTAARSVQDAFAQAFRLTLDAADAARRDGIARLAPPLLDWCRMAAGDEARALRQALLFSGLDQWGQAWSRAYGAGAMTGLSELLGVLRDALDPAAEAAVQAAFARLDADESGAFAFKAELRKSIFVALWHTLIAEEDRDAATALANQLGGLLLGTLQAMPRHGWVVVASTLADIQIRCLAHGLAQDGLAQEMTQQLFAALAQALSAEERKRILGGAGQAVIAWQQAQRATAH